MMKKMVGFLQIFEETGRALRIPALKRETRRWAQSVRLKWVYDLSVKRRAPPNPQIHLKSALKYILLRFL